MSYTISKDFEFSASHQLVGLAPEHPCSRLHGHNYTVKLSITGDLNDVGFVVDYRELAPFKELLDGTFDHQHINAVMEGNPTAERMAEVLGQLAVQLFEWPQNVHSVQVSVSETGKTWAAAEPLNIFHNKLDPQVLDSERYRWNDDSWRAKLPETEHHEASITLTGEGNV